MSEEHRQLLRRFEPILRFTHGERFFPMDVRRYVENSSLWVYRRGKGDERLVAEGELSLEDLGKPRFDPFRSIYYLKFIEPLNITELAAYRLRQGLTREGREEAFHAGPGRLARVGYGSRFLDAIFSISLLARGRVPGDTAAAAAVNYERLQADDEQFAYYGRVVSREGWLVLQYWFFYPFNNWRSGFFGVNDHEGDWEMISLYLYENDAGDWQPEWVAYANHDFGGENLRRRWDDPELERSGEHVVVYPGAGSHANYFRAGEYLAELELPLLSPLVSFIKRLQGVSDRLFGIEKADDERPTAEIFKVPFVDYARGDGLNLGPGQEKNWTRAELITPPPAWVSGYRGLWGLWAQDPVMGENAPGGPMYERFGRVRRAWHDPLGWAGLAEQTPPSQKIEQAQLRAEAIRGRLRALEVKIADKSRELRNLGLEANAMLEQPHMQTLYQEHRDKIVELNNELDEAKEQAAEDSALLQTMQLYIRRLEDGHRQPSRAHLQRPLTPSSRQDLRMGRVAEAWAAVSIGLMLVAFVGILLFARQYLFVGIGAMIGVITLVEAVFRRRLRMLITWLTNGLAIVAFFVLLIEFFWQILIGLLLFMGIYILWENLRELWT